MARFKTMVDRLEENLGRDPHRARAALYDKFAAKYPCFRTNQAITWWRNSGSVRAISREAVGSENFVVAGAGFEPATFGL